MDARKKIEENAEKIEAWIKFMLNIKANEAIGYPAPKSLLERAYRDIFGDQSATLNQNLT